MKQIAKITIFIAVVVLIMTVACSIKKHRLGGFRISKIMKTPSVDEFPEFLNDEKLDKILSNTYRFLGKGTQFYAFISEDHKYVVKILRADRLMIPTRMRLFKSYASKIASKNKIREKKFLKACKIAYSKLKDRTGVLYLHLNPTVNLPKINVVDNFGISKKIDLNSFCFLVQKKVTLIKDSFFESKKRDDTAFAKKKIESFFQLLKIRADLEISNSDPRLFQNFGFINDRAVELDFGDFYSNPYLLKNNSTYASEIDKYALVLRSWLVSFWPELIPYFDEQHNYSLQR